MSLIRSSFCYTFPRPLHKEVLIPHSANHLLGHDKAPRETKSFCEEQTMQQTNCSEQNWRSHSKANTLIGGNLSLHGKE